MAVPDPGNHLDQLDRLFEAFQLDTSRRHETQAVDLGGAQRHAHGHQHLAGRSLRAEPSRRVQRGAAEASLHGHRLAGVDPYADPERQRGIGLHLLGTGRDELGRRQHGLRGRLEHGQSLVAAQFDHAAAPGFDRVACEVGKP